jgi:hypothetical protein
MPTTTGMPVSRAQGNIPAVFQLKPLNSIDLFEVSLTDLQGHLMNGSFTSVDYIRFCLERIRQVCNSTTYLPMFFFGPDHAV